MIALFVAGVAAFGVFVVTDLRRSQPPGESVRVVVPEGASFASVVRDLVDKRLVRRAWTLEFFAKATRGDRQIQRGTYEFTRGESALDILGAMIRGDILAVLVTVPEGSAPGRSRAQSSRRESTRCISIGVSRRRPASRARLRRVAGRLPVSGHLPGSFRKRCARRGGPDADAVPCRVDTGHGEARERDGHGEARGGGDGLDLEAKRRCPTNGRSCRRCITII
jgi:hypothetical protein